MHFKDLHAAPQHKSMMHIVYRVAQVKKVVKLVSGKIRHCEIQCKVYLWNQLHIISLQ